MIKKGGSAGGGAAGTSASVKLSTLCNRNKSDSKAKLPEL